MRTLIVDDDDRGHLALKDILAQHHPEIRVIANGYSVKEGLELIGEHEPDLLFLDIEMPDGTGFDLLNEIRQPKFHIIFVTGFNQYAQTAIRFGALDYLTKPVSVTELSTALIKVRLRQVELIQLAQLEIMRETLRKLEARELPQRMSIATSQGVLYFSVTDIIRLEAMQNFTEFILQTDGRRLIASHNLKKFESDLKPYKNFMRIHKSYLANLLKVIRLIKGDKWKVEMADGKLFRSREGIGRRSKSDWRSCEGKYGVRYSGLGARYSVLGARCSGLGE